MFFFEVFLKKKKSFVFTLRLQAEYIFNNELWKKKLITKVE